MLGEGVRSLGSGAWLFLAKVGWNPWQADPNVSNEDGETPVMLRWQGWKQFLMLVLGGLLLV